MHWYLPPSHNSNCSVDSSSTNLTFQYIAQRAGIKRKESWVKNNANKAYYELSKEKSEGESSGLSAKLDKMKAVFAIGEGIQKGLDSAASIGEKFGHIGQWKVHFVSHMCWFIMIVASVILYYVSLRYLIIAWGLNKFRKYYFKPNLVDNNEVVDLLSRVPSFPEIEQYRQVRSRQSNRIMAAADGNGDSQPVKAPQKSSGWKWGGSLRSRGKQESKTQLLE